jgi:hypothetical protein
MTYKRTIKTILGKLPFTAEVYWRFIQRGKPVTNSFSLRKLEKAIPAWCTQAAAARKRQATLKPSRNLDTSSTPILHLTQGSPPRRILIFATLRYWIEHATLLGTTLAGLGHQVTLAYLPYPNYRKAFHPFDVRRHNAYARSVLQNAAPLLNPISLLDVAPASSRAFPAGLMALIHEVAVRDTQYTLQIEHIEQGSGKSEAARLYRLRLERNLQAAAAILGWIQSLAPAQRPELLITPNGSILEMGAVYQAVRSLGIPAVTYEFGEQRGRIWFAQDSEVMLQETDPLWQARQDETLSQSQWEQIRALYTSRQNASLWENFARLWQGIPSQGGEQVRQALGLDERPVAVLAANVIGDSLTLGRQVFSKNMTEWLERSVQFFAGRPDVQLVVRIHPGERYLKGPSVAQVVQNAFGEAASIPAHIHLVQAPDPINTYDLMQIADVGLVYTTTVGMEMAMCGVQVVVGGRTHYRGKGFTHDPASWEEYFQTIDQALDAASRAAGHSRQEIERAWVYAYRFFFDYPTPFPWHLLDFWDQLETWSVERVLSEEGQARFGDTFRWLAGEPRRWE